MKTISTLSLTLALVYISAIAGTEALAHSDNHFSYEEVPVFHAAPNRMISDDFSILYEGTPTYEKESSEEAEIAAFEEIGETQEQDILRIDCESAKLKCR